MAKKVKGRPFDCPTCSTRCYARKHPHQPNALLLNHPKPVCAGYSPKLLMVAYVTLYKPETRFPGMDDIAKEVYQRDTGRSVD